MTNVFKEIEISIKRIEREPLNYLKKGTQLVEDVNSSNWKNIQLQTLNYLKSQIKAGNTDFKINEEVMLKASEIAHETK